MTSSDTDHVDLVPVDVNGRWTILMPPHRAARPEWPWYEAARFAAMRHFLKSGDVVYDIGSEEGDHAAVFASWGCDVVLAEPNPLAWPCARAIFAGNKLEHHVLACWPGFVEFAPRFGQPVRPGWPQAAYGPVRADHGMVHRNGRADPHTAPFDTPSTSIDALADWLPPPTCITIDVEGAELQVLQGAERTLARCRPIVFVSIHPGLLPAYGASMLDVIDFMWESGYPSSHLATDHEEHWMFRPHTL